MTTPPSTREEVTQLLGQWSNGNEGALEKLFPLVQPELHRLAHHYMGRGRPATPCKRLPFSTKAISGWLLRENHRCTDRNDLSTETVLARCGYKSTDH